MAEVSSKKVSDQDPEQTMEEARRRMQEYDYVRLTWYDLNGAPRSRVVPGRHASMVIPGGYGVYEGALYTGPRSQLPGNLLREHNKRLGTREGNMYCIPDSRTLRVIPWAGVNEYKVGEMLCNLVTTEGTPLSTPPRCVAQKQLDRLDAIGLKFMSSYELEFILEDRDTHKPVFDEPDIFNTMVFGEHEKLLFQVDQQMLESGVNCEMFQTEYSPGQFEITMVPVWGIEGGDKPFILKYGLKEIAHQYGLEATFMAKPYLEYNGSGAHFNFSVWKKTDDSNVFYDKDDVLGLSTFARHWIGGMMKHCRALSAIQSPTVNCYRRLQGTWAPSKVCWGIDTRSAALRVKVGGVDGSGTYMENRLPSGSANYYLVLAATIAAGMDGVDKKLEPPPEGIADSEMLPLTLEEALAVLEADDVIVKALGSEFVEWFCLLKRLVDLELLKDSDMTNPDLAALEKERHMYNITI